MQPPEKEIRTAKKTLVETLKGQEGVRGRNTNSKEGTKEDIKICVGKKEDNTKHEEEQKGEKARQKEEPGPNVKEPKGANLDENFRGRDREKTANQREPNKSPLTTDQESADEMKDVGQAI